MASSRRRVRPSSRTFHVASTMLSPRRAAHEARGPLRADCARAPSPLRPSGLDPPSVLPATIGIPTPRARRAVASSRSVMPRSLFTRPGELRRTPRRLRHRHPVSRQRTANLPQRTPTSPQRTPMLPQRARSLPQRRSKLRQRRGTLASTGYYVTICRAKHSRRPCVGSGIPAEASRFAEMAISSVFLTSRSVGETSRPVGETSGARNEGISCGAEGPRPACGAPRRVAVTHGVTDWHVGSSPVPRGGGRPRCGDAWCSRGTGVGLWASP